MGQGSTWMCFFVRLQGCHTALLPGRSINAASATLCSFLTPTPSSLFLYKDIPPSLAVSLMPLLEAPFKYQKAIHLFMLYYASTASKWIYKEMQVIVTTH